MTKTYRIILNTAASYGRSVYGLVLGLFSARWALSSLGESDLGLYSVVGSLVLFVGFLNAVSGASIARFYAYSVGKGMRVSLNEASNDLQGWFNTALSVHVVVPIILVVIGYPVGVWLILHCLEIPQERICACICVLRVTLGTMFINMVTLPYVAMYTAHQYIANLSAFGVISSTMIFLGTFFLQKSSGDRLVQYSMLMFFANGVLPIIQALFAYRLFSACRIRPSQMFRLNRLKRMFGFAGWQLFGGVGNVLRAQGSAILVNLSFGARVNAAFSIANQVCAHSASLSASLQGALTPAVTTAEGAGRHDEAKDLSFRACKFSVLLVLLFAIPLISEIDYVLRWWLKTPPMFTSQFCIGMLIVLLIDKLTFGHMVAITAVGKIAGYQATLGTLLFITPFIGWIMINMGMDKIAVPLSYIITVTLCTVGRLVFCRGIVGMSIGYWFKSVFVRVTFVATIMFAIGVVVKLVMEESFLRLAVTTFTEDLALIFISYWFALDKNELNFIAQKVKGIFQRWRT